MIFYGSNVTSQLILWRDSLPFGECLPIGASATKHTFPNLQRDVIFEGYTDSLTVKLLNKGLATRNLAIRCSVPNVVRWDMYCRPVYDGDCTNTGFEVSKKTIIGLLCAYIHSPMTFFQQLGPTLCPTARSRATYRTIWDVM